MDFRVGGDFLAEPGVFQVPEVHLFYNTNKKILGWAPPDNCRSLCVGILAVFRVICSIYKQPLLFYYSEGLMNIHRVGWFLYREVTLLLWSKPFNFFSELSNLI